MELPVGDRGETRERGEVRSSEGQWRIMTGGVKQMVITEGGHYKYLGVMVLNLGERLSLSAFWGTEDIRVHIVHISHVIITYTLE